MTGEDYQATELDNNVLTGARLAARLTGPLAVLEA